MRNRRIRGLRAMLAMLAMLCAAPACASTATPPPPADPLTAAIHVEDAERFARLFAATNGAPTAADLQREYLDPGSYGVTVFTPDRIGNAAHLAQAIARDPAGYARAIRDCLPRIAAAQADLRAIYLALHGLLPDRPLPQIYVVFGAGSSGGTAGPGAQVLGLEVLCAINDTPDAFRATLRRFFAHETVHTFQHDPAGAGASPLLSEALVEGAADYVAALVTGQVPDPERDAWASAREHDLWVQFRQDMATARALGAPHPPASAAAAKHRWVENYQSAPAGWPYEAGYWVGMRIWQSYVARAPDAHRAIAEMLAFDDPEAVLRESGYQGGPASVTVR